MTENDNNLMTDNSYLTEAMADGQQTEKDTKISQLTKTNTANSSLPLTSHLRSAF